MCNGMGIFMGLRTLQYFRVKHYSWRGLWSIPSYRYACISIKILLQHLPSTAFDQLQGQVKANYSPVWSSLLDRLRLEAHVIPRPVDGSFRNNFCRKIAQYTHYVRFMLAGLRS